VLWPLSLSLLALSLSRLLSRLLFRLPPLL
jgi:hypothetical protein